MTITTRVTHANASGEGTVTVPPSRLVSFTGPTAAHNLGRDFTPGYRLPPDEEFVAGTVVFTGADPGEEIVAFFDFG